MDDFTKTRVTKIMEKYVETKIPKHLQNQIKITFKIRGNNVTLMDQNKWKVYWRDSKDKWHWVEDIKPDEDFEKQLKIVDKDNRGLFWG